ncbi:MAG: hypothetical protein AB7S26_08255 [Sandaracinaceae bacterium]
MLDLRSLAVRWVRALVLGTAVLAAGCDGTDVMLDGGTDPPPAPRRTLTLESEPSLTLTFQASADVEARLTEMGRDVAREPITFALEGTAHDSSLADLMRETDTGGRARTSLTAGTRAAVFRVRANAEGATPVYVDVSVGNDGFGGLHVNVPYGGVRVGGVRRAALVYVDVACDDVADSPDAPARATLIEDPETPDVTFRTLPAGLSYTVVGRLLGPGDVVLAHACVEEVVVARDTTIDVDLELEDEPLDPTGMHDIRVDIESGFATELAALATASSGDLIGEAAAGLYLDALEDELMDRGLTGATAALAMERSARMLDAVVGSALDTAGEGPAYALAAFFADLAQRLAHVQLAGPLTLTRDGVHLDAAWTPTDLVVGPLIPAPDSPAPLFLDPSASGLTIEPTLTLLPGPGADDLAVEPLVLDLPLLTLVTETILAMVSDAGGADAALMSGSGCGEVARVVGGTSVAAECDDGCVEAACARALRSALDDATMSATVGPSRTAVELGGAVHMTDDNADLAVDRFEGTLSGTWSAGPPTAADEVNATLEGARMIVTQ